MPKLQELDLPTVTTVFVCILKKFQANVAGKHNFFFSPNLVFFQGTRRNKQPSNLIVTVTRLIKCCFSDQISVTGPKVHLELAPRTST